MPVRSKKEKDLLDFLYRKLWYCDNEIEQTLKPRRERTLDRYYGKPWQERKGKSKVQTRETYETVEWAAPMMARTIFATPNALEFVPQPGDEDDRVKSETRVVNHHLFHENEGDGFIDLGSIMKNGLLFDNTYAKVYLEELTEKIYRMDRVKPARYMELEKDEDVKIVDVKIVEEKFQHEDGSNGVVANYDVNYCETRTNRRIRVEPVPPDEFLVDPEHDRLSLETCRFVAHRKKKTGSDLKAMGINPNTLDDSMSSILHNEDYNEERMRRLFYIDENSETIYKEKKAHRTYWLYEIYIRYDYDNDGFAELRKVRLIGHNIIENEPTDYMPFVAGTMVFMPNAHLGVAPARSVEGLQEELTILKRNLYDNTYALVRNRKYVNERAMTGTENTLRRMLNSGNELLTFRAEDIRMAVMDEQHVSVIDQLLPVIQNTSAEVSKRSGVAPENNIDPAVLQQATVGAFITALDRAGERIEMYIRTFVETSLKYIFRKVHQLYRKYPEVAEPYLVGEEWVQPVPDDWPERTKVRVSVGLGFINKQQLIASLIQLLEIQANAGADITNPHKRFNLLAKLCEAIGLGIAEDIFVDPSKKDPEGEDQLPPPQIPPEVILAQSRAKEVEADARLKAQENQQDHEKAMAELTIKAKEVGIREIEALAKLKEADVSMAAAKTGRLSALKEIEIAIAEVRKLGMDTALGRAKIAEIEANIRKLAAETEKTKEEADAIERGEGPGQGEGGGD